MAKNTTVVARYNSAGFIKVIVPFSPLCTSLLFLVKHKAVEKKETHQTRQGDGFHTAWILETVVNGIVENPQNEKAIASEGKGA